MSKFTGCDHKKIQEFLTTHGVDYEHGDEIYVFGIRDKEIEIDKPFGEYRLFVVNEFTYNNNDIITFLEQVAIKCHLF